MNDELSPGSGTSGQDAPASEPAPHDAELRADEGPATAGGLIRVARLAQGIDLASLAAMLKIPLRKLEALENDRHDELQGPTFERALAQAACRVLKIDPKPVLALMPQVSGNTLEHVTGGLNKPFRERQSRGSDLGETSAVLRPVGILAIVLALGGVVLFLVPETALKRASQAIAAVFSGDPPSTAASTPVVASNPAPAPAPAASVVAGPAVAPFEAASAGAARVAAASAALPAAPVASGVDEVLAHAAPPPNIPLQVNAIADTWVEVLDAQGRPLLSRTVVAGESVGLDGAMPMHVKVGNVRGTKLVLRGDNVDLAPYTRDNVARLELK